MEFNEHTGVMEDKYVAIGLEWLSQMQDDKKTFLSRLQSAQHQYIHVTNDAAFFGKDFDINLYGTDIVASFFAQAKSLLDNPTSFESRSKHVTSLLKTIDDQLLPYGPGIAHIAIDVDIQGDIADKRRQKNAEAISRFTPRSKLCRTMVHYMVPRIDEDSAWMVDETSDESLNYPPEFALRRELPCLRTLRSLTMTCLDGVSNPIKVEDARYIKPHDFPVTERGVAGIIRSLYGRHFE